MKKKFPLINEVFISLVYFVQGSAGIVGIASSLILRERLGLDFFQIGIISAASVIPWSIKPLYGLLTDLFPINGYRRKPYLHIGPLLGIFGFLYIAIYARDFSSFLLAIVFANIGFGLTDVATDGLVVEQSDSENVTKLQGLTQASIRIAAFFTSFFSGLLIYREIFTPFQMYYLAAVFPAFVFILSFFVKEKKITKKIEHEAKDLFSPLSIIAIVFIFIAIISNMIFPEFLSSRFYISKTIISLILWSLFFVWMSMYFLKLKKLKLTTGMIFLAALFILLWRFNPSAGSPLFFYIKDTLGISEEKLGFIDTASQIGSILAVILSVKFFDKFNLKSLLGLTVIIGGLFGFLTFAITRSEIATAIGNNFLIEFLAKILAIPVYFFETLFSKIFSEEFVGFFEKIKNITAIENFLFVQNFLSEMVYMIAYIPLLKFIVLICPKKAEATNYAVIASIMNIGLALSSYASGWFYEFFKNPNLPKESIDLSAIEILIWINVGTSMLCLFVLPFLKIDFKKEKFLEVPKKSNFC